MLAKMLPVSRDLFDCCVDLGYQALDTAGNARETRDWAREHNITRSLIVVTSNYHMPRALAELSAALPDVDALSVSGRQRTCATSPTGRAICASSA